MNKTLKLTSIFLLATSISLSSLATSKSHALEGDVLWSKSYGGFVDESSFSEFNTIVKTADGGYITAGEYIGDDVGDYPASYDKWSGEDIVVKKVNKDGNTVWTKHYGGTYSDYAYGITTTIDNGFLITGTTTSSDNDFPVNRGSRDAFALKLNSNGDKVWATTFGGSDDDMGQTILQKSDGTIFVIGSTSSQDGDITSNQGGIDIMVAKLDTNGNKIWVKTYGGPGSESASSAVLDSDGGIVFTSSTNSAGGDVPSIRGWEDIFVMKIDGNGDKVWAKTYGGTDLDVAKMIKKTQDGGFIIVGDSNSTNGDVTSNKGSSDFLLLKLDANGDKQWLRTSGGSSADGLVDVVQTPTGDYLATGSTDSSDGDVGNGIGSETKIVLVKYNSSGVLQWVKKYGGNFVDQAHSMLQDNDKNVVIVGLTMSTTNHFSKMGAFILKIDFGGNNSTKVNVGLNSGSLSLTAPLVSKSFDNLTLNGLSQQTYANLNNMTVADLTGTGSGWHVNVSASQFLEKAPDGTWDTEGTRLSLPRGSLKIAVPQSITPSSGGSTAPQLSISSSSVIDNGTVSLLSASLNTGKDQYAIAFPTNAFEMTIGPTVKSDPINYPGVATVYESIVTWTIVTGP